MAILICLHILFFFVMATPSLSSTNKLLKEKNAGNYDSEKLGFGLGFSFPSYGIGFGGDSGGSNGNPGQRRDDSGFNFGLGFDLGGGNGYGDGGGGSVGVAGDRPNNCRCTCDRGGGISGKSNGKNEGNERYPPGRTVACRPMNCNGNDCGGYSKREDGSSPYWCKVSGKGIVPFWCNGSGESSGKVLNCEAINCPKGANCGEKGTRFVLDIPVWVDRRIEPGHY